LQDRLARKVIADTTFDPSTVQTVAGVDVGFRGDIARAAVVVVALPDLTPVDSALAEVPVRFPYVPGFLALREGPAVLAAFDRLATWPDLILFDAQGLAHPRRLGLASHIGVLLDWPSIGCAKSRFIGTHDEPGNAVGDWVPLFDRGDTIGAVLRTRVGVKPLFVSIGHRVNLPTALEFVLSCTRGFRLPETTRLAHKLASGKDVEIQP
jgi:deoxyribonuclease V